MGINILILQLACLPQVQFGFLILGLIQELHSQKKVGTCQAFPKSQVVRPTSKPFCENLNGSLIMFLLSSLISYGEVEAPLFGKSLQSLRGDIVQSFSIPLHLIQGA